MQYGWRKKPLPREDLYDLILDPAERSNLASDTASRPALEEMRARLDAWMDRTHDPLLKGPIPLPHGATVNRADGVSPKEPVGTAR